MKQYVLQRMLYFEVKSYLVKINIKKEERYFIIESNISKNS